MAHESENGWRERFRKHSDLILAFLFVSLAILDLVIRSNDIDKLIDCGNAYRHALNERTVVVEEQQADVDKMLIGISTILSTEPLPSNWQAQIGNEMKVYYAARAADTSEKAKLEPVTC